MEKRLIDSNAIIRKTESNVHMLGCHKRAIMSALENAPTVEAAEVVHARWEDVEPGHDILFRCSNCGRIISSSWGACEDEDTNGNNGCDPLEEWLSCPTCGARMDGKAGTK